MHPVRSTVTASGHNWSENDPDISLPFERKSI
jgi:hypothetical protein